MTEDSALGRVVITASAAAYLSAAFHQNSVPAIHEITIENGTAEDLVNLTVRVESEPAFFVPLPIRIERVPAGTSHHIRTPDVRLDSALLRNLSEGVRGALVLIAETDESPIASASIPVQLLPPNHWGGSRASPELLAAFVRPNDPAVDAVLHDAAVQLAGGGKVSAIDGYRAGTRERSWELASAIWSALANRAISYVLPPASFERGGQKVRAPSDILERRIATCLDLTLLYAACLEQAGLNALLVLNQGHAFVGLWLKDEVFPAAVVDDMQILRKRRDLDELILIETTLLTHLPAARFSGAVRQGSAHVDDGAPAPLEFVVDLKRARSQQIKPLDFGDDERASVRPEAAVVAADLGLDEPPAFTEEIVIREKEDETVDRLDKWKRKLLDLTLRNKLLNFKATRKAVSIDCPDPALLEDLLASGRRFKVLPGTAVLGEGDPRSAALYADRHHEDGRRQFVLDALNRDELHATIPAADLEVRLTELFRMTRTAFEEGGSNILFLAFGFLKWTQKDGAPPHRAPLLLVPVSLQRSSVRSGFRLALHEDEVRLNPTLLQMLRQDFSLRIPELEGELPTDANGINLAQIWRTLRIHIRDMKGWEVSSEIVLSTFSFTKFLMWKDLVERMEQLKLNPVVRHLIDTPKQTYSDGAEFPNPRSIDTEHHPSELFTPLSSDSSQLAAVLAAAGGKDFVLFGPPGTGKSQTIANMVAQCLAAGKTILFVAQKTAALEVVQRRLNEIGLGGYCLEVHSTKAQKSAVLNQLRAAWHERAVPTTDDWATATRDLARYRDELNALVSVLHRRRGNGMSAYQAFGRTVANREQFLGVRLDWPDGEQSPEALGALRETCRELCTALKEVGDPSLHPLRGIEATEWSPARRREFEAAIEAVAAALPPLRPAAERLSGYLALEGVSTDLHVLRGLVLIGNILARPEAKMGAACLASGGPALDRDIAQLKALQERASALRAELSTTYRPAILKEDLRALLREWTEASAANFLTRGGKRNRVRQKLQPFATAELQDDVGRDLATMLEIRDLAAEAEKLAGRFAGFGTAWASLATDTDAFAEWSAWGDKASQVANVVAPLLAKEPADALALIVNLAGGPAGLFEAGEPGATALEQLRTALAAFNAAKATLSGLAGRDPNRPLAAGPDWIAETETILARWKGNLNRLPDWCNLNAVAGRARTAGLAPIVDAVLDGSLAPSAIEQCFETLYARWWTERVVTEDPVLRSFLPLRHEETIARFRAADERVAELTKGILRAKLHGDVPAPTAFGADPEWGTLSRELIRKSRHMPLRQLFSKIPNIVTRLTPCVMMSPLSIAQYLPPGSRPFDVVIFDEASQIPVWDAIGAIARGKQVVVVGDPEQLPPTSVGERGVDDIEDGTDVEDQESILSECIASNIPPQRLNWHYRSRHESLIAFSNKEYYNGRLVTFPSPVTSDRAVHYVHVPGGI